MYDAAHAFGVKVNGVGIGNFGDVSMFSLHATKVFHAIEGGILTYKEDDARNSIELFKNFGISGPETVEGLGINAKMNEFQAAMGLVNLRYIASEINKRKSISIHYKKRFDEIDGVRFLPDFEGVEHNYAYFPILINSAEAGVTRDEMHERLKEYNIMTRKYFYPLCSDFDCYKSENDEHLENAKIIAEQVMTVPIYSELSIDLVDYICDAVREIVNKK